MRRRKIKNVKKKDNQRKLYEVQKYLIKQDALKGMFTWRESKCEEEENDGVVRMGELRKKKKKLNG